MGKAWEGTVLGKSHTEDAPNSEGSKEKKVSVI